MDFDRQYSEFPGDMEYDSEHESSISIVQASNDIKDYASNSHRGQRNEVSQSFDFPESLQHGQNKRQNTANDAGFFGQDFEVMPVMNKLYDVLRDVATEGFEGVNLPTLVAVGDQSQGKTSVLESIVKQQFLPKGDQIQTRCPIEIQLVHIANTEGYAEIYDDSSQRWIFLRDMQHVRNAIQERTDQIKYNCLAGVTDKRIVVKIYSNEVPDLQLVDLPGFLTVSTEGQTDEITAKIKDVVRKEISNPNSIILAVTAAGNNIGTSTALKEALRVDPNRERTLGIITKLDLMDRGTNCEDVLRGNQYRLNLGFVGVVCRNFEDNAKNLSIEEKIMQEKRFLSENYPSIACNNGIPYLTRTISQLLLQRIYQTLPGVRANIERLIQSFKSKLDECDSALQPDVQNGMMFKFIKVFETAYSAQIDGRKRAIEKQKYPASAKIQKIYKKLLKEISFPIARTVTDQSIDRCIKNNQGLHNMMRPSVDDTFQEVAKEIIQLLREPIADSARKVNSVMFKAIKTSCTTEMNNFPKLVNFIALVVTDLINECFKSCEDYLQKFMDAEQAQVYSSEKDFMKKLKAKPEHEMKYKEVENKEGTLSRLACFRREAPGKPSETDEDNDLSDLDDDLDDDDEHMADDIPKRDRKLIRRMAINYFNMVKQRVMDHCPKAITNLLVYSVADQILEKLLTGRNKPEYSQEYMKESVMAQKNRVVISERLQKFISAREIIHQILREVIV